MKHLIHLMSNDEAPGVGRLHAAAINKGFLSKLGNRFLSAVYRGIAADAESCVFVAASEGAVLGFCAYSRDVSAMYRRILRRRAFRLFFAALPRCLYPWVIKEIMETLRYPAKQQAKHLPPAEILSIGISEESRGTGVGRELLEKALRAARQDGIETIKVLAGEKLEGANRFYQRCGFTLADQIEQHGEKLNVYVRATAPEE